MNYTKSFVCALLKIVITLDSNPPLPEYYAKYILLNPNVMFLSSTVERKTIQR